MKRQISQLEHPSLHLRLRAGQRWFTYLDGKEWRICSCSITSPSLVKVVLFAEGSYWHTVIPTTRLIWQRKDPEDEYSPFKSLPLAKRIQLLEQKAGQDVCTCDLLIVKRCLHCRAHALLTDISEIINSRIGEIQDYALLDDTGTYQPPC